MTGYREVCLQTKGEICTHCGSDENIVVHHKDGDRQNNHIDNLVPLCESCHKSVHAGADDCENQHDALADRSKIFRSVGNVKTEWRAHTVYLNNHLSHKLSKTYKKLRWLLADFDFEMEKTRHYYPLVVHLGLTFNRASVRYEALLSWFATVKAQVVESDRFGNLFKYEQQYELRPTSYWQVLESPLLLAVIGIIAVVVRNLIGFGPPVNYLSVGFTTLMLTELYVNVAKMFLPEGETLSNKMKLLIFSWILVAATSYPIRSSPA